MERRTGGAWDKYRTVSEVSGRLFEGEVNILNGERHRRLYDVTKNKDITERTTGLSQNANAWSPGDINGSGAENSTSSNKSIPKSDGAVNDKKSRLKFSTRDSEGSKLSEQQVDYFEDNFTKPHFKRCGVLHIRK